jgi:hypothetical protein
MGDARVTVVVRSAPGPPDGLAGGMSGEDELRCQFGRLLSCR